MKKVLTIITAAILLASGMRVSIDRHFCGGNLADVRISLTGKMAWCGMEQSESDCPHNPVIDKKCCEDQVSFYGINTNYYPEHFKFTPPASERDIIPRLAVNNISGISYNPDLIQWVLPPGDNLKTGLTQPEICVFRI
jgi:hypothetical protein